MPADFAHPEAITRGGKIATGAQVYARRVGAAAK
jgi:hypothetical protein